MKVILTGRRVTLKPTFENKVQKRMAKFDRFFDGEAEAAVTVTVEKNRQTVEITVVDRGVQVRAERCAASMEEAFEAAADLLLRRLIKNRTRLKEKLHTAPQMLPEEELEPEEREYDVAREKHVTVKPETLEEAILEMNLLAHDFHLFLNADTGNLEIVYRRRDNTYGLLIPSR